MKTSIATFFRGTTVLAIILVLFASCKTVPEPEEIPEDLTQAELFQRAQEAVDEENWEAALVYYETFLTRFPQDHANRAAAKYEVAFIYYRRGELERAEALFEQLLQDYQDPALEGALPQWPRILAEKILTIIEEERQEIREEEGEEEAQADSGDS
jgi:outer membrane protein assembly factor BamD